MLITLTPDTTDYTFVTRSSILTGKYVHNHYTYENSVDAGCNAPTWRSLNENSTIGTYLQKAGYKTGFFGKYNEFFSPSSLGSLARTFFK